jgi:hypothetical protein
MSSVVIQKSNNRCSHNQCNKKLLLSDLSCRCELRFCSLHRQPELHQCSFNYKSYGKEILEKTVVGCQREKVEWCTTNKQ